MTQHNPAPSWQLETLIVHGGKSDHAHSIAGRPTIHPIYASTTYLHASAEALDQAFSGTASTGEQAYVYARQGNPNADALEVALTRIEGGVGAVTFGSGMAAIHAALMATGLGPGMKVMASQDLYGPTIALLRKVFEPNGVEIVLADLCCTQAAEFIQTEQPDVVYVETLSNPLVKVIDLAAIARAAHEVGAVTIVDSTFTTPYLVRPIEHGCDLVVHSATKYIGGHGDSTGGVVISARNALLDQLRAYAALLGAMLSPFESHLMLRGLRTLSLRMKQHCDNALQVARYLQGHEAIACVYYPGLSSHPQHALAAQLLSNEQYGGLLSFELKAQSRAAAYRFMDRLRLCLPATTLGDIFSLVSYPPMSSHRTMTEEELRGIGITKGCIRMSVGIENIEDIVSDLDQALAE
jgi:cystathionine gamma-synthase/methionine-gamma-lyase